MDETNHPQSYLSVGSRLSQARKQAGLSISDISERIKFNVHQIEALENDQFEQLGLVFSRGFLRSYARALELDADELIADLPNPGTSQTTRLDIHNEQIDLNQRKSLWKIVIGILILLAILIAPWLIYRWLSQGSAMPGALSTPIPAAVVLPATGPTPASTVNTISLPGNTTKQINTTTPLDLKGISNTKSLAINSGVTTSAPVTTTPNPSTPVLSNSNPTTLSPTVHHADVVTHPQPSSAMAVPTTPALLTAASPSSGEAASTTSAMQPIQNLQLQFNGDAWVRIRDSQHHILTSHLYHTGQHVTFSAPAPLSLVIGNAVQVSLTDNGQTIQLMPFIKNKVAVLTLGSTK